jgi:hypothetical protein
MFFLRKDPIKQALDANLDGDFSVFACGANAPREDVIRSFEARLGYSLPKDFRKFSMSPYGGIYIEVKEAIWPKTKPYEVGQFWSFLRGMMTYGFASDTPEWMRWLRFEEIYRGHLDSFSPDRTTDRSREREGGIRLGAKSLLHHVAFDRCQRKAACSDPSCP